jgi:hypothetical protein
MDDLYVITGSQRETVSPLEYFLTESLADLFNRLPLGLPRRRRSATQIKRVLQAVGK